MRNLQIILMLWQSTTQLCIILYWSSVVIFSSNLFVDCCSRMHCIWNRENTGTFCLWPAGNRNRKWVILKYMSFGTSCKWVLGMILQICCSKCVILVIICLLSVYGNKYQLSAYKDVQKLSDFRILFKFSFK